MINIVTRSGSNRFEIDGGAIYQDYRLRLFEDKLDRGKTRLIVGDLNVGGPIVRDKLWFFVSGQAVDNSLVITHNPNFPEHPPLQIYGFDGLAKLTWRISTRHELSLKLTASPGAFNNLLQSVLVEPEAEARQFQRTEQAILTYQYTGELFIRGLLGFQQQRFNVGPQSCEWDPDNCTRIPGEVDVLTGILRQNYTSQTIDDRLKLQFTGTAEYTLDRFLGGEHGLKFTWNYIASKNNVRSTVPGDMVLNTIGGMPFSREEYCSNDPMQANGECRKNYLYSSIVGESSVFSLPDRFRLTRYRYLTLNPAVSMLVGSSENDQGVEVTDAVAFTPRRLGHLGRHPRWAHQAVRRVPGVGRHRASWRWPRSPRASSTSRTAPGMPKPWPTCAIAAARAATTAPPWACPAGRRASAPTASPAGRNCRPHGCGKACSAASGS